jgi:predicted TIM-barrel fold metal-dependent hydrolase
MDLPLIVSVDDHVVEPADLWQRRLPAKHREAGPKLVRRPWEYGAGVYQYWRPADEGPEAEFWVVGGVHQAMGRPVHAAGLPPERIDTTPMTREEMRPGFTDVKARLEDMDVIGVERSLCFPNASRFAGQLFLWVDDKELSLACVEAYNDWMVEEWAGESGGRLIPLCMIPLWDPQLAAAEVRRNAARGVRAVTFSELPASLGLPSIHDADGHWLPFFEACAETGTVVCIHIGSSSSTASTSADAPLAVTVASTTLFAQLCLADWLCSGLLPRLPDLKIQLSESQIGWMPFVLERLDRVWQTGNEFAAFHPAVTELPSSYMAGRVFACFFEDDFGLRSRDAIGIDQITFETDYPHQDSTWPYTQKYVEETMADLTEEERHKILRGNALRMFDLPEQLPEQAARA